MAKGFKTDVSPRYRGVYVSSKVPDKENIKIMRNEISKYKNNLLKSQQRLKEKAKSSIDYTYNEKIVESVKSIKLKDLHTDRQIQNAWHRLREISQFEHASITNINYTNNLRLESLHMRGIDFVTKENLADFGRFMDYVRENSSSKLYDSEQTIKFIEEHKELLNNDIEELYRLYQQTH